MSYPINIELPNDFDVESPNDLESPNDFDVESPNDFTIDETQITTTVIKTPEPPVNNFFKRCTGKQIAISIVSFLVSAGLVILGIFALAKSHDNPGFAIIGFLILFSAFVPAFVGVSQYYDRKPENSENTGTPENEGIESFDISNEELNKINTL